MTHNLSFITCPDLLAKLWWVPNSDDPDAEYTKVDKHGMVYRHLSEATDSDYYEAWGRLAEECGKQDIWIEPDNDGEELRWWICGPRAADFDSPFTDPLLALHAAYAATKGK